MVNAIFVWLGIILFVYSISLFWRTYLVSRSKKFFFLWLGLACLTVFFLLGYLGFSYFLISGKHIVWLEGLVSQIFFWGAVYVLITAGLIFASSREQKRIVDLGPQDLLMKKALEESEKKFKVLYESSHDAIMILEPPTWAFTAGNQSTIKMFCAKNEKEFTSKKPYELSPEYQPDGQLSSAKALKMINHAVEKGSNFFEWQHKRISGEDFPATVLLTRMELRGKQVLQATVRDITKRKQDEERIAALLKETQAANEQLKKMDKTKDEFLSVVTHDLKSPLVPIEGYADLLAAGMAGQVDEKQKRFIKTIKQQARKMRGMIDTILDYTRVEFGKVKINAEKFSLNELLIEDIEELKPDADYKKMKIELNLPSEDLMVSADRGMIGRVMANLMTNAVKYTPEAGKISVSLTKQGHEVRFDVEDNGKGIAQANLPRLFDKFFMVEEKGAREKRSLGLGLHISKDFIEAHSGKIWVESKGEGKGSRFSFTLPLA